MNLKKLFSVPLYFAQSLRDKNRFLKDVKQQAYSFLITHNFGGGTEVYVKKWVDEHDNVLIIRPFLQFGQYDLLFTAEDSDLDKKCLISKKTLLSSLSLNAGKIIVNSLVGFRQLQLYLTRIAQIKKNKTDVNIEYMVHDFHCICPVNLNLTVDDVYCRLECDSCRYKKDTDKYRTYWHSFFDSVDLITCFSDSGKKILSHIYPVCSNKIKVVPHTLDTKNLHPVVLNSIDRQIKIAIVGCCTTPAKGLKVVREFCAKVSSGIKVFFIGADKEEIGIERENILYTGRYKSQEELQKYVEDFGINLSFFPSVCPETFSFTISELIAMGLPVIAFNVGAQGERVAKYKKGVVVENLDDVLKYLKSKTAESK